MVLMEGKGQDIEQSYDNQDLCYATMQLNRVFLAADLNSSEDNADCLTALLQ